MIASGAMGGRKETDVAKRRVSGLCGEGDGY